MQPTIPKFDGHMMENILHLKEYWNLVENEVPVAPVGTTITEAERRHIDEHKLKDMKAKNYLFQALD